MFGEKVDVSSISASPVPRSPPIIAPCPGHDTRGEASQPSKTQYPVAYHRTASKMADAFDGDTGIVSDDETVTSGRFIDRLHKLSMVSSDSEGSSPKLVISTSRRQRASKTSRPLQYHASNTIPKSDRDYSNTCWNRPGRRSNELSGTESTPDGRVNGSRCRAGRSERFPEDSGREPVPLPVAKFHRSGSERSSISIVNAALPRKTIGCLTRSSPNTKRSRDLTLPSGTQDIETETEGTAELPPRASKRSKAADISLKLACPFFKRNSEQKMPSRACFGPGWETVHRVKEHLYRCHAAPKFKCPRCCKPFTTHAALTVHQRSAVPCELEEHDDLNCFDADKEAALRCRKRGSASKSEADRWIAMFRILFPDDDEAQYPSPYYEHAPQKQPTQLPDSSEKDFLSRFDTCARRLIPDIVEQESGAAETEDPAIKRSEMTSLVLRVHSELIRIYSEQIQAETPTRAPEDPAPAAPADADGTDLDSKHHHLDIVSERTCRDDTNLNDSIDWSTFDFSNVENHESGHDMADGHRSIDELPLDYFVDLNGPARGLELEPTVNDNSGYISGALNTEDASRRQEPFSYL